MVSETLAFWGAAYKNEIGDLEVVGAVFVRWIGISWNLRGGQWGAGILEGCLQERDRGLRGGG